MFLEKTALGRQEGQVTDVKNYPAGVYLGQVLILV
jgi:hypothetical protein